MGAQCVVWSASGAGAQTAQTVEGVDEAPKEDEVIVVQVADDEAPKEDEVTVVDALDPDDDLDEVNVNVDVNVSVDVRAPATEPYIERPRSKHFIAEASGGITFTPGLGGASHLLLGAGGRLRGGFLRFYAMGGLSHESIRASHFEGGAQLESSRPHLDVIMGLRVYVPLFGPLRPFTDFLGGGSHVWSSVNGGAVGDYDARGWRRVFIWAIGLHVRVTQDLSVGGRVSLRTTGDPLEDLREHLGLSDAGGLSLSLGGTASWHF